MTLAECAEHSTVPLLSCTTQHHTHLMVRPASCIKLLTYLRSSQTGRESVVGAVA
jgi:hypothetical protein